MATQRYRALIKVNCNECRTNVMNRQRFDVQCSKCEWLTYSNVQEHRLKAFREFLDNDHPNWIFWHLYYYVKGVKATKKDLYTTYKNGLERIVP